LAFQSSLKAHPPDGLIDALSFREEVSPWSRRRSTTYEDWISSGTSGRSELSTMPRSRTPTGDRTTRSPETRQVVREDSTILPVEIIASSANGAINSTFDFKLNKALVIILPKVGLAPPTLNVSAGQTVTWLNLADNTDENGYANVLLGDGSAPSPTLGLNDVWSHTFDKPGSYPYQVTITLYPIRSGVVIVT